jgi:hypothetical protein
MQEIPGERGRMAEDRGQVHPVVASRSSPEGGRPSEEGAPAGRQSRSSSATLARAGAGHPGSPRRLDLDPMPASRALLAPPPAGRPASFPSDTAAALRAPLGKLEIAALLAVVLLVRALATRTCPIYDDAFITYRYARNLAGGLGLVFNPGAPWEPVLGTTTPLYALLMAGLQALHLDAAQASVSFNALCDVVTGLLLVRSLGGRRVAATVALLAFATLPHLVRISVGGMESPLFALLGLAAASALYSGRPTQAGLWAALDCVVRPEGVLLVAVLALERLRRPRELARMLVPVVAVGLVSSGLLYAVYGDIVPQSVHAKSALHASQTFPEIVGRWGEILKQAFAPDLRFLPLVPLVLLGLWPVLRARGAGRVFSAFALAITASYLAARPHLWGWYFFVPLVAWCLWLGAGSERAVAMLPSGIQTRLASLARPAAVLVLGALAVASVAAVTRFFPSPIPSRVYAPMQAWARETSKLHPNARILASDIGAIGWAWQGTVLDSEGLTWPQALDYVFPNAMIEAVEPEFLLIVAERPRLEHFYSRGDLKQRYVAIARFGPEPGAPLEPELAEASPWWVQDYVLYQRRDF